MEHHLLTEHLRMEAVAMEEHHLQTVVIPPLVAGITTTLPHRLLQEAMEVVVTIPPLHLIVEALQVLLHLHLVPPVHHPPPPHLLLSPRLHLLPLTLALQALQGVVTMVEVLQVFLHLVPLVLHPLPLLHLSLKHHQLLLSLKHHQLLLLLIQALQVLQESFQLTPTHHLLHATTGGLTQH